MSSGVTETGQRWNDHIYLKFHGLTLHRYEHVNRQSLDSKRAHTATIGFLCLMSCVVIRFSRSLTNTEISDTYRIVRLAILGVYF